MDTDPGLLYSLVVVVVGGLGTLSGAVAGSVLVGPADTFGKVLFQDVALAVIFAIVALVLLLKPTGLLGRIRIAR
jgi:branched-chain amino acid transport system permease protein